VGRQRQQGCAYIGYKKLYIDYKRLYKEGPSSMAGASAALRKLQLQEEAPIFGDCSPLSPTDWLTTLSLQTCHGANGPGGVPRGSPTIRR